MMVNARWIVGCIGVVAALGVGCGDSGPSEQDLGPAAPLCMAGAKDCLADRVARVCAPDGQSWVPVQCRAGEICTDGTCGPDPMPACTPADDTCMNDTTALRCSMTGKGFDVVNCPADTKCKGGGICAGSCVVGSSICNADGSVATCGDGKVYTTMICGANQRCVQTGTVPYQTAACKPAECQPDADGCDFVCGNKTDAATANDPGFRSFCTATSEGYKWVGVQCDAGKTCSPTGATCGGGRTQASCRSECNPGEQRCTALLGGGGKSAMQTCGADGKWAAAVPCNPNPANGGKVCFAKPGDNAHVLCGDAACAGGPGACDASGKFHACGSDGLVASEGSACASGVCTQIAAVGATWQPGACVPQCKLGEERCLGGSGYQACTADGTWGAVQSCASSKTCFELTTPTGTRSKTCGDCAPGTSRCTDMGGSPAGGGSGYVQSCFNGAWATTTACTVGTCQPAPWNNEASCVAECIPNEKSCAGSDTTLSGTPYSGTTQESVCSATGKKGAPTNCPADTMCRKTATGHDAGCVPCVGGANEFGLPDTRCVSSSGAAGSTHVQTCLASSSGWQDVATLAACAGGTACVDATTDIPAPPYWDGPYCHNVSSLGNLYTGPATDSALRQIPYVFSLSCTSVFFNHGAPISCASKEGGSYPDCCSIDCYADPQPLPARCE